MWDYLSQETVTNHAREEKNWGMITMEIKGLDIVFVSQPIAWRVHISCK